MILVAVLSFLIHAHGDQPGVYEKDRKAYLLKDEQNRNVLSQLFEMQKNLKKINHEKGRLISKKENIEKQIEKLNPLVQSAEGHLLEQKIGLQKRLIYISKFQNMSLFKILFSSQTPSELDRNLRILKNLSEKDYHTIKKYFASVKVLKAKKEELSQKNESVVKLQRQVEQQEALLHSQTKKKNHLLVEIQNQKKNLLENLKNIRQKAIRNDDDLKKQEFLSTILEPLFFEKKGTLELPATGKIVQKYGYFEHPSYKTQIRHKGIFIRAPLISDVKAVAGGSVAFIERNAIANYTLVIDHGDHYYSVYSYLGEPTVGLEDKITEGQVISHAVSLNPYLGEGVYFELRHFSEPEDPQPWFASRRKL